MRLSCKRRAWKPCRDSNVARRHGKSLAGQDGGTVEIERTPLQSRAPLERSAMYERFTDRARRVMQLANQEAIRLGHEYIGTEHILLGLIAAGEGVAANVLQNLN